MAEPVQQRRRRHDEQARRGDGQQRPLPERDDEQRSEHRRQDEAAGDPDAIGIDRLARHLADQLAQQGRQRDGVGVDDAGAARCPQVGHEKNRQVPAGLQKAEIADLQGEQVDAFARIAGVHQPRAARIGPERPIADDEIRRQHRADVNQGNDDGTTEQHTPAAVALKTPEQAGEPRSTGQTIWISHEPAPPGRERQGSNQSQSNIGQTGAGPPIKLLSKTKS